MAYEPCDHDGPQPRANADEGRSSTAPLVLTAIAALAMIAVLSPRFREAQNPHVVYTEAIAPGPIPSTERRPDSQLGP